MFFEGYAPLELEKTCFCTCFTVQITANQAHRKALKRVTLICTVAFDLQLICTVKYVLFEFRARKARVLQCKLKRVTLICTWFAVDLHCKTRAFRVFPLFFSKPWFAVSCSDLHVFYSVFWRSVGSDLQWFAGCNQLQISANQRTEKHLNAWLWFALICSWIALGFSLILSVCSDLHVFYSASPKVGRFWCAVICGGQISVNQRTEKHWNAWPWFALICTWFYFDFKWFFTWCLHDFTVMLCTLYVFLRVFTFGHAETWKSK